MFKRELGFNHICGSPCYGAGCPFTEVGCVGCFEYDYPIYMSSNTNHRELPPRVVVAPLGLQKGECATTSKPRGMVLVMLCSTLATLTIVRLAEFWADDDQAQAVISQLGEKQDALEKAFVTIDDLNRTAAELQIQVTRLEESLATSQLSETHHREESAALKTVRLAQEKELAIIKSEFEEAKQESAKLRDLLANAGSQTGVMGVSETRLVNDLVAVGLLAAVKDSVLLARYQEQDGTSLAEVVTAVKNNLNRTLNGLRNAPSGAWKLASDNFRVRLSNDTSAESKELLEALKRVEDLRRAYAR